MQKKRKRIIDILRLGIDFLHSFVLLSKKSTILPLNLLTKSPVTLQEALKQRHELNEGDNEGGMWKESYCTADFPDKRYLSWWVNYNNIVFLNALLTSSVHVTYRVKTTQAISFISNDFIDWREINCVTTWKNKELKGGFKTDVLAITSVRDLHRQVNISLELNSVIWNMDMSHLKLNDKRVYSGNMTSETNFS